VSAAPGPRPSGADEEEPTPSPPSCPLFIRPPIEFPSPSHARRRSAFIQIPMQMVR
jgi:hypothetical protein